MAHVHIRELTTITNGRGKVNMIFHIPIASPYAGIAPTPVSEIASELLQPEIDDLAAGRIAELSRDIVVTKGQTVGDVTDKIKLAWRAERIRLNNLYDFTYKYFGATIADASS